MTVAFQMLENIHPETLVGKRVGYYPGSFDPIHEAHRGFIEKVSKLVDLLLIYPVPGGDHFKTNRTDVALRKEMVKATLGDKKFVIMTDMSPGEMQDLFAPFFGRIEFVGIMGSDIITDHLSNPDEELKAKMSAAYLRGVKIPEKHRETTIGAIMALPVTSFIVSQRNGVDLSFLKGMFEDRRIDALLRSEPELAYLSSTKVRKTLQAGESIEGMVDPKVIEIIRREKLYQAVSS